MDDLSPQQLLYEADLLSAWAGEQILWDISDQDDELSTSALIAARLEHSLGLEGPSQGWSGQWGLLLGIRRLLSSEQVELLDGAPLAAHQVEVLESLLSAETERIEKPPPEDPDDPNRGRRVWIEHATGAGKTRAAVALVDAARTGRVLILTSRKALVDQFTGELSEHGYGERIRDITEGALHPQAVCVTTYQMFNRLWDAFDPDWWSLVICDEAHNTLGEVTSGAIMGFEQTTVLGMTATGELISSEVSDLFPVKLSSFDLIRATELGVLCPLRVLRVPPAVGLESLEGIQRRGGDWDQGELSALLNRDPFNHAAARFYRDTFGDMPGVIYAAGIDHAEALASCFLAAGVGAVALSGKTPDSVVRQVLDDFGQGKLTVLVNDSLLAEGWDAPLVSVCLHLAPTASRRVYQQRVGRITRRFPGKGSAVVVDFVDPDYRNDGRVVTMHSLLDIPMYIPGEPVTRGPDGPPPDLDVEWFPAVCAPTASDPSARQRALTTYWRALSPEAMGESDRILWARAAGSEAPSPNSLKDSLRALSGDPDAAFACLEGALNHGRSEVRLQAADRLAQAEDPHSFEALCEAAIASDDPSFQRALTGRVLESAGSGAQDSFEGAWDLLLRVAALDRSIYERAARKQINLPTPLPSDPQGVREVSVLAVRSPDRAGAGLLACLPHSGEAGKVVEQAARAAFTSPSSLARSLKRT